MIYGTMMRMKMNAMNEKDNKKYKEIKWNLIHGFITIFLAGCFFTFLIFMLSDESCMETISGWTIPYVIICISFAIAMCAIAISRLAMAISSIKGLLS